MRVTRAERLRQITSLRGEGLTAREIAECLGITVSGVRDITNDPDGSKQAARRTRYEGTCVDCGAPTSGCNGREKASERCVSCRTIYQTLLKVWTREAVIDAFHRFAAEYGRRPTVTDWRYADPERGYPNFHTVYNIPSAPFASWADAVEAAGYARPRQGQRIRDAERAAA